MIDKVLFSSDKMDWRTPSALYEKLNEEFNFTLDVAADDDNALCKNYYTIDDNALAQSWDNDVVFCNPPYSRGVYKWVKKASEAHNSTVVMLIPARTDTKFFHEFIYNKAEIRFIKGRLKFSGSTNSAPFPSMIVVFRHKEKP